MLGRLERYRQLISSIGFEAGTAMAARQTISRMGRGDSKPRAMAITPKGVRLPILLRPGTSDVAVFSQIFVETEYREPSEVHARSLREFYDAALREGRTPVILDCGANIGCASIWYANRFPEATIISVEPEPANFAILMDNVAAYRNVVPVNAGISSSHHKMVLSNTSDAPWAWETTASETGDISAITVDDALRRVSEPTPFIAKVDIEGFEIDLFQSDYDWVKRFPLIVFEHHDRVFPWKGTAHAFYRRLTEFGPRDYVEKGENVFSYSHDLLKP